MIEILHLCTTRKSITEDSDSFIQMHAQDVVKVTHNFNVVAVHIGPERHLFMTHGYFKGWRIGRTYIKYEDYIRGE